MNDWLGRWTDAADVAAFAMVSFSVCYLESWRFMINPSDGLSLPIAGQGEEPRIFMFTPVIACARRSPKRKVSPRPHPRTRRRN
jgi:hypothetical protein